MFLPETIDLGQSEKYILSIRITSSGFMFSIHEPGVAKNYCLRTTSFSADTSVLNNIQRIVFDLNFLTQEFAQTNIILVSFNYNIVPSRYFDSKKKAELHNFTQIEKSEQILSCANEQQKCTTLFGIDKDLYSFLSRSLYNPKFYHHTHLLIDLLKSKGNEINLHSIMYLNFHENILDIICFSRSKLVHCLTYENELPANQIYYILKLWEQAGMNQTSDLLYISGQADGELINTLQEYIKHIRTLNIINDTEHWNEDAKKAPLDLITLSL